MRYAVCAGVWVFCICCVCLVVALFWVRVWPAPEPIIPVEPPELVFPAEVVPPEVPGAQWSGKGAYYPIYLNVTEKGTVVLVPSDQFADAQGNVTNTLDNAAQVETYLKRRAKEDEDKRPQATIILRVDARTPFEKTYDIVWAARRAGYVEFHWVATYSKSVCGAHFETRWPRGEGLGADLRCTVRLTAEAGKLAKITFRGPNMADSIDLGTDFEALDGALDATAAKHPDAEWAVLVAEIDGQLLQADVIRLFATTIRTGFLDVRPMLLDPKKP